MAFLGFGEDKPMYATAVFAFSDFERYSDKKELQKYIDQTTLHGGFLFDDLAARVDRIIVINLKKKNPDGKDERGLTKYFDYVYPPDVSINKLIVAVLRIYDPGWGEIDQDRYNRAVSIIEGKNECITVYTRKIENKTTIFNDLLSKHLIEKSAYYFDEKELKAYEEAQKRKAEEEARRKAQEEAERLKQQAMQEEDPQKAQNLLEKAQMLEKTYVYGIPSNNVNTASNMSFLNNPMVLIGIGFAFVILILTMKK